MSRNRLRRWLCRHRLQKCGESLMGNVYRCTKCNSIYAQVYTHIGLNLLYMGEYEDYFDENGKLKFFNDI